MFRICEQQSRSSLLGSHCGRHSFSLLKTSLAAHISDSSTLFVSVLVIVHFMTKCTRKLSIAPVIHKDTVLLSMSIALFSLHLVCHSSRCQQWAQECQMGLHEAQKGRKGDMPKPSCMPKKVLSVSHDLSIMASADMPSFSSMYKKTFACNLFWPFRSMRI